MKPKMKVKEEQGNRINEKRKKLRKKRNEKKQAQQGNSRVLRITSTHII